MDERTGWRSVWSTVFLRKMPKVNWGYTLGSATLFVVTLQMATGILLTLYYVPEPEQAYASVDYISNELAWGWLVRGLHHWGATAMMALVVLHMIRVIMYASYKYPREITWITGVFLLLITFAFGFTGYLLPWDQRAFWATTVGTRIADVVPVIGDDISRLMLGGEDITGLTLVRFFGTHVWVLPIALLGLLAVHLYLVVRNGITAPPDRDE
jgi:quinol-cytochrome oxidoreductase complex cytochrome b subunit